MSLSPKDRTENMHMALKLMVEEVDDQFFKGVYINNDTPRYNMIVNTTWQELVDRYYAARRFQRIMVLTGHGWLTGITLLGKDKDPDFQKDLGILSATLKDQVKGRSDHTFVATKTLHELSGLPIGFIRNILASDALPRLFNKIGPLLGDNDPQLQYVIIPVNYGLPLI